MTTAYLSPRDYKSRFAFVAVFLTLFVLPLMNMTGGVKFPRPSQAHMIFGIDERQLFPLKEKPWLGIGRVEVELENQTWGNCTGSLIDRDLVLTSAHCLIINGKERGTNVWFRAGVEGRNKWGEARVTQRWVGTEWPDRERAKDWAVLRIDHPLGDKTGWLSMSPELLSENLPISVVGYADDFQDGRTVGISSNCKMRFFRKLLNYFTHDCDMNSGTSGAPMVLFNGTTPQVVALNVAHTTRHPIHRVPAFSTKDANVAISLSEAVELVKRIKEEQIQQQVDQNIEQQLEQAPQPQEASEENGVG